MRCPVTPGMTAGKMASHPQICPEMRMGGREKVFILKNIENDY